MLQKLVFLTLIAFVAVAVPALAEGFTPAEEPALAETMTAEDQLDEAMDRSTTECSEAPSLLLGELSWLPASGENCPFCETQIDCRVCGGCPTGTFPWCDQFDLPPQCKCV